MIRRHHSDGDFLLISQHDHALLSRRLAEQLDPRLIAPPAPREPVLLGIALHDCGWPLHDEHPTLNGKGLPLDVFETPREIGLKMWTESVDRAAAANPYAGLLVSLHVLALSQLLGNLHTSRRDRFEINKFHHAQIERQESLRRELEMPINLPLQMGLARKHADPHEDKLRFHLQLLQAMDRVSLALCCTNEPFSGIDRLAFQPGGEERAIAFNRDTQDGALSLDPWPFDADELHEQVPCRRMPATPRPDVDQFRAAYDAAPVEMLKLKLRKK